MKNIISFDLDGTLVSKEFADEVWLNQIPQLYAKTNNIDIITAKKFIEHEYEKIGSDSLKWYDIHYWLRFLKIEYDWKKILEKSANKLKTYTEVKSVLKGLYDKYNLIIISNAAKEFIEFEMNYLNLNKYFLKVFSAVSDYKKTKKDISTYLLVSKELMVNPHKITHIGDTFEHDYISAKKAGLNAYYLNRNQINSLNNYTVKNLVEFVNKINKY